MRAVALITIVVVLVWPARALLVRARWTASTPRAAVALWQAIGITVGVALIGACYELAASAGGNNPRRNVNDFTQAVAATRPTKGLTPNQLFALTAALIVMALLFGALASRAVGQLRARARHRMLIDLVGQERADVPGALVLEHPSPTAYGIPGRRPRIVVSSAAVASLSKDELEAVLAHERAHLRARHDLVLFPFRLLGTALPRSRALAAVGQDVESLLEMAADDRVLHGSESCSLARALCRMATADNQVAWLTARPNATTLRVQRALAPRQSARLLAIGSGLSALCVLALPFIALFVTFGGR